MGEYADDILNGDVDQYTGEWIGNGQGYPRSFEKEYSNSSKIRGIENWLKSKNITISNNEIDEFLKEYQPKLNLKHYNMRRQKLIHISGFCFNKFTEWVLKKY